MKIIGLTGSIGMGKSVLARQFRALRIPVHDADACVHALMMPKGPAFAAIARHFPQTIVDGRVDRGKLGKIVFADDAKRHVLEAILHPLVRKSAQKFVWDCRRRNAKLCVLDIPLLFETGRDRDVDHVVCATAPQFVQIRRVLNRKGMTKERLDKILSAQLEDGIKRVLSDTVVNSARGRNHTLGRLKKLKKKLLRR